MTSALPERYFRACLVAMLIALSGCASLPSNPQRHSSVALSEAETTPLAGIAKASLPNPSLSGFRLEPIAAYAFDVRLELAARATRTLDVQYYVLHDDATGKSLLVALRDAAARGVRVRVLLDDLYTSGEDPLLDGLAAFPNIEIRLFNPFVNARGSVASRFLTSLNEFDRVNHRMHNKLFVADNAFAVVGGRNIADEYFMRSAGSNFVDLDVLAAGPVVRELSGFFDAYWNSPFAYPFESVLPSHEPAGVRTAVFDTLTRSVTRFPTDTGVPERLSRYTTTPAAFASGHVQLTQAVAHAYADPVDKAAGANDISREGTVRAHVADAMRSSQTEVFVVSPYFIPGEVGLESMRQLSARGVRLRLLTNSLASTDEPLVHTGYARYRVPMLKMGVEIYELGPELAKARNRLGRFGSSLGSIHAKIAVIDHKRLFVGSMNLDDRSERRNTELGIIVDSPELSEEFIHMMDFDSSVYRLRLSADGLGIEWLRGGADDGGVLTEEPETSAWLRFKVWLLSPLVPESEL
jgi:putative cardiolipin synthase